MEANTPDTADYYTVIERPMCLSKIESRLEELAYFSTPEIVSDLRLILENCYRFNGASSWVSRMACKVGRHALAEMCVLCTTGECTFCSVPDVTRDLISVNKGPKTWRARPLPNSQHKELPRVAIFPPDLAATRTQPIGAHYSGHVTGN